ncbi:hypothetical protein S40293_04101 [Stachybotrys chartarum IBT 40293]|nr:hypothetical protein S40293_04101 [Stachybotrys chartarum IBT 40293]
MCELPSSSHSASPSLSFKHSSSPFGSLFRTKLLAMGALRKGCGTCKRRKVKCDNTQPRCTRCCNAGIECSGFAIRLRFVDERPRIQRSVEKSHAHVYESTPKALSLPLAIHAGQTRRFHPRITPSHPADALPLTAVKDNVFMSYLLFKLFETSDRNPMIGGGETRCGVRPDWTLALVKIGGILGQKSWAALAALVFGQAHSSRDATISARELYGQALSEFRHRLSRSDDQSAKDGLASLTALYMYEIAKSIISGQSTFLCQSRWKTLPWEDDPGSKSAIDYLVDIGADIAGYVAQTKRHNDKSNGHGLERSRLTRQVAASLQELNCWWQQWEANRTQLATEVALDEGNAEPLFPTLLEYDLPWTAFAVCTYNAMRILLLQLSNTLQLTSCQDPAIHQGIILDIPNQTALLGITSDMRGLAREILRSLTYSYRMSRRIIFSCGFFFIRDFSIHVTCTTNHPYSPIVPSDLNPMPALPPPPTTFIRRDDLDDMREETEQSSRVLFYAPVILVSIAALSFTLCFVLAWRRRRHQRQASHAHMAYTTVESPDGDLPRYPESAHASPRLSNDQMPPAYDASEHNGAPRHDRDASAEKQQHHGHKRGSGIWGSLSSFGSSVGSESSLRR